MIRKGFAFVILLSLTAAGFAEERRDVIQSPVVRVSESLPAKPPARPTPGEGVLIRKILSPGAILSQRRISGQTGGNPAFTLSPRDATLQVIAKKSIAISVRYVIQRLSIGDPKVADVVSISRNEFLVSGKTPGTTNLIVWSDTGRKYVFTLLVRADAEALARGIEEIFPGEPLKVLAVKDTLVLSGAASRDDVRKAVADLAEFFAPKKVINLVRVSSPPIQIALKVQIA